MAVHVSRRHPIMKDFTGFPNIRPVCANPIRFSSVRSLQERKTVDEHLNFNDSKFAITGNLVYFCLCCGDFLQIVKTSRKKYA